jgi:hypothetical protein
MEQAFVFSCASFYIWSGKLNVKSVMKIKQMSIVRSAAATKKRVLDARTTATYF